MADHDLAIRQIAIALDRVNGQLAALSAVVALLPGVSSLEAHTIKSTAFRLTPPLTGIGGIGGNSPAVTDAITALTDQVMALAKAQAAAQPAG